MSDEDDDSRFDQLVVTTTGGKVSTRKRQDGDEDSAQTQHAKNLLYKMQNTVGGYMPPYNDLVDVLLRITMPGGVSRADLAGVNGSMRSYTTLARHGAKTVYYRDNPAKLRVNHNGERVDASVIREVLVTITSVDMTGPIAQYAGDSFGVPPRWLS